VIQLFLQTIRVFAAGSQPWTIHIQLFSLVPTVIGSARVSAQRRQQAYLDSHTLQQPVNYSYNFYKYSCVRSSSPVNYSHTIIHSLVLTVMGSARVSAQCRQEGKFVLTYNYSTNYSCVRSSFTTVNYSHTIASTNYSCVRSSFTTVNYSHTIASTNYSCVRSSFTTVNYSHTINLQTIRVIAVVLQQ